MLSSGPGVGGRDDLGARLLAEHPRGEEWRQLDITVANLTLDQLIRMGGLVEPGDRRAAARAQLIEDIDYRKTGSAEIRVIGTVVGVSAGQGAVRPSGRVR
jgi:hypothetical protein